MNKPAWINHKTVLTSLGVLTVTAALAAVLHLFFTETLTSVFGLTEDWIVSNFAFNVESPALLAAFISNYVHMYDWHLEQNLTFTVIFIIGMLLVFWLREIVSMPVAKSYFAAFFAASLLAGIITKIVKGANKKAVLAVCTILVSLLFFGLMVLFTIGDMQNTEANYNFIVHITGMIFGYLVTIIYDVVQFRKTLSASAE
ncbi:MAG TPA: hypothetical protein O0W97_07650 [Methanocorpusculum sp.]|nr:hypothetical protein [Methanocorpusculum sp.]HJJ77594.1 hypothetical protein [Methanocorpusculum sp.]